MPRNLGFRSDVRQKMTLADIKALYKPLGMESTTKTDLMGRAILMHMVVGARLVFPGHVLNAQQYRLVWEERFIPLPSRAPQWLYDQGMIDAGGAVTEAGAAFVSGATEA